MTRSPYSHIDSLLLHLSVRLRDCRGWRVFTLRTESSAGEHLWLAMPRSVFAPPRVDAAAPARQVEHRMKRRTAPAPSVSAAPCSPRGAGGALVLATARRSSSVSCASRRGLCAGDDAARPAPRGSTGPGPGALPVPRGSDAGPGRRPPGTESRCRLPHTAQGSADCALSESRHKEAVQSA